MDNISSTDTVSVVKEAAIDALEQEQAREHPVQVALKDLQRPLPVIEGSLDEGSIDATRIIQSLLDRLYGALEDQDLERVKDCFNPLQSYWRDQLALTAHLRTFTDSGTIARAILETSKMRRLGRFNIVPTTPRLVQATPTLSWIDCFFYFDTASPSATCGGMLQLIPVGIDEQGQTTWRIWTFATWLKDFRDFPENETLLKASRPSTGLVEKVIDKLSLREREKETEKEEIIRDVLIIGAGNAGLILAARLKAFNVSYIAIDKAERIGDNWSKRYDAMQFHLEKAFCEFPYLPYKDGLPQYMKRDDLAEQCIRFAREFDLEVLNSTVVKEIEYDTREKVYTVVISCPSSFGERRVRAKHVVQATGVGSAVPYKPRLENEGVFKGTDLHSAQYKNPTDSLGEKVKKVLVVGSANTAFDVVEDCHKHGKQVTMLQRSPTYVIPAEFFQHPTSIGLYNILPADIVDSVFLAGPIAVGSQLVNGSHSFQASMDPHRYDKLAEAGFQVLVHGDLMHHLLERCGGHYVDMGSTALIADKKVGIVSGAHPVAYTGEGVKLSDGTELSADALIWCTGFSDKNLHGSISSHVLGATSNAQAIADQLDATWALDQEGEIRGLYKRQSKVENYWLFGGFTSLHRYYSRVLALQIKGALEGILPEPYLKTPRA